MDRLGLALVLALGALSLGISSAPASAETIGATPLQSDTCGDRRCQPPDDCRSCPEDCGECDTCGDRRCQPPEDCNTCPGDCGRC